MSWGHPLSRRLKTTSHTSPPQPTSQPPGPESSATCLSLLLCSCLVATRITSPLSPHTQPHALKGILPTPNSVSTLTDLVPVSFRSYLSPVLVTLDPWPFLRQPAPSDPWPPGTQAAPDFFNTWHRPLLHHPCPEPPGDMGRSHPKAPSTPPSEPQQMAI